MNLNQLRRFASMILVTGTVLCVLPSVSAGMTSSNNTPFPSSLVITAAHWAGARHGPPSNQFGDILPIAWGDDNNLYVLMDDGGTDPPKSGNQWALWRNSFARISGAPLHNLRFRRIGASPPPATWPQIHHNQRLWSGPLGSHYATGFTSVDHTFFATQLNDWNWNSNGLFAGLAGIAYSTDRGNHWTSAGKAFPAPLGNLNWVQYGRDSAASDGYAYAIGTEREFNASTLILGRSQPTVTDVTTPSRWQWDAGWAATPAPWPAWSHSYSDAQPILSWPGHITYPRMSFDPGLRRYLLTFTYSYASTPPGIWQNGSELVILDAPHPWGPFTFVARQPFFGPSNGYDPGIPDKWISDHGQVLWLIWSANFDGCAKGLSCRAGYGFNYQRIWLTVRHGASAAAARPRVPYRRPQPPAAWRKLPATRPPFQLPRLHIPGR